MLRITGLSLLLGALAVIAGLNFFFLPPSPSDPAVTALPWDVSNVQVDIGASSINGSDLHVTVETAKMAIVTLPTSHLRATDYSFLHLSVDTSDKHLNPLLMWSTLENGDKRHFYKLEIGSTDSVWLATSELRGWQGTITSIQLFITGLPGESVIIRDISLYPSSTRYQLQAVFSDLTGFIPWNRAAMNSHTGVTRVSSFYPVTLAAAWLFFSLCSYVLVLVFLRKRLAFDLRVVALLFLGCWIFLDLSWQKQLVDQVADTRDLFAGKTTEQKLAVGPDAELFGFVSAASQAIETHDARVFVATTDDYTGLRTAYYLLPLNSFYSFYRDELPDPAFLRSGDYVALIKPTRARHYGGVGTLKMPGFPALQVETIVKSDFGTLLRLQ